MISYNEYLIFGQKSDWEEWEDSFSITKIPTVVKAPKVTAKLKKSKLFKVTVKNKNTKKAVKKIKVKINRIGIQQSLVKSSVSITRENRSF